MLLVLPAYLWGEVRLPAQLGDTRCLHCTCGERRVVCLHGREDSGRATSRVWPGGRGVCSLQGVQSHASQKLDSPDIYRKGFWISQTYHL